MHSHEVYRQCASILVYRPHQSRDADDADTWEFLLLHKPRKCDAWQLPQGGVEAGESVEQAALRELQEEAGIEAEVIGASECCYQYDFPRSFRRLRPDNVCGQCVHFVFAKLKADQMVQVDEEEINGYVWVVPRQLKSYVKRREYLRVLRQLLQEGEGLL